MFGVTTSDDYQPVTWVGRHPVHVTTLLVGIHTLLMVAACLLSAFGAAQCTSRVSFTMSGRTTPLTSRGGMARDGVPWGAEPTVR